MLYSSKQRTRSKKAAAALGDKSAEMIHVKELPSVTGYIRGGCSPIGMKKRFPTFFDASINQKETVYISARYPRLCFMHKQYGFAYLFRRADCTALKG